MDVDTCTCAARKRGASVMASACWRRSWSRLTSCCRRAISAAWGSGFGPRRLAVKLASWPAARSRRQLVRWDEYRPSRRSKAPISPGGQASAASKIRRFSAVEKTRRSGLASTSETAPAGAVSEVALGVVEGMGMTGTPTPYSKLPAGWSHPL